jgi:hypothetical protein
MPRRLWPKGGEVKYARELQAVVDGAVQQIALSDAGISPEPTQTVQEILVQLL